MKTQSLLSAFRFAFSGLFHFFRNDRNGRLHLLAVIIVSITGFYLHLPVNDWMILLICFALVIGFEMCNYALEKLCDLVEPGIHPVVKKIKDVAAAAVLWSAIISVIIGLLIFIPKISSLL